MKIIDAFFTIFSTIRLAPRKGIVSLNLSSFPSPAFPPTDTALNSLFSYPLGPSPPPLPFMFLETAAFLTREIPLFVKRSALLSDEHHFDFPPDGHLTFSEKELFSSVDSPHRSPSLW